MGCKQHWRHFETTREGVTTKLSVAHSFEHDPKSALLTIYVGPCDFQIHLPRRVLLEIAEFLTEAERTARPSDAA